MLAEALVPRVQYIISVGLTVSPGYPFWQQGMARSDGLLEICNVVTAARPATKLEEDTGEAHNGGGQQQELDNKMVSSDVIPRGYTEKSRCKGMLPRRKSQFGCSGISYSDMLRICRAREYHMEKQC